MNISWRRTFNLHQLCKGHNSILSEMGGFQTVGNSMRKCWNMAECCGQEWEKEKRRQRRSLGFASEEAPMRK